MRDLITKDFWWKLFALVAAVIIWYTVRSGDTGTSSRFVPSLDWQSQTFTNLAITVRSAPGDLREIRVEGKGATVVVHGRPEDISVLRRDDLHAIVDVTGLGSVPGQVRVPVHVLSPPGIALINVSPAEVGVMISPRPVPVQEP
jgi:hypothetical protein